MDHCGLPTWSRLMIQVTNFHSRPTPIEYNSNHHHLLSFKSDSRVVTRVVLETLKLARTVAFFPKFDFFYNWHLYWAVNNDANQHICHQKEPFADLQTLASPYYVWLLTGQDISAEGLDTCILSHYLTLTIIYFVSLLSFNLLSVFQIALHNFCVITFLLLLVYFRIHN